MLSRRAAAALLLFGACRGTDATPTDAAGEIEIDATDMAGKAATCASTFGTMLTDGFGRIDGTILAVVPPGYQNCAQPNGTHLVLQVTMLGAAYRMVVNVESDVAIAQHDAPLAGPAWSEGWHLDAPLDYVTTLGVHSTEFSKPDITQTVTDALELGAKVSVFASDMSYPDSAHLVHRYMTNADGAIVISPDSSPHYLLFRFDNQTF